MSKYRFKKFIRKPNGGRGKPRPYRMQVGDIVERCPCREIYRTDLKNDLRRLMEINGWEFSIYEDAEKFVIRRDK